MISKVAKVKSSSVFNIKTLSEYLRFGHKDEPKLENERVKNFFTLNMYSDDLETATLEMMYTASLNIRSKCSKYMHLVLSLSEGEKTDLNTWKKIINDYVKEVGMENHQVIAVQHNDNGKEHFHLIINRIDTNSHARTNNYQLYRRLQKFDEEIEKKYNLKQFDHKADTVHNYQQAAINRAKDVEKKTGHQTFLSYLLEHKEDIKKVNSWKELQHKLSEFDCTINIKGRGLVIKSTNPEHPAEVKASSFDRDFSYSKLLKKWGLPPDLNNQSSEPDDEENKKEYQRKENLKHTFEEKPLTKNAKVQPQTKEELAEIIRLTCEEQGWDCNLNFIDTSKITDMSYLFSDDDLAGFNLHKFNGDISNWNTANVFDMYEMFSGSSFNNPLNNWNVSNVECTSLMFACAKNFNQSLDKWKLSKVCYDACQGMFLLAKSFKSAKPHFVFKISSLRSLLHLGLR